MNNDISEKETSPEDIDYYWKMLRGGGWESKGIYCLSARQVIERPEFRESCNSLRVCMKRRSHER